MEKGGGENNRRKDLTGFINHVNLSKYHNVGVFLRDSFSEGDRNDKQITKDNQNRAER